jgi:cellulose synthase (UDP-forming)
VTTTLTPRAETGERSRPRRQALVRFLVALTLILGTTYVIWRWLDSVNWSVWWIAVPLLLAEMYSLGDAFLFGATMWRRKERGEPPPPPADATVDVLITTYNEPVEMVLTTATAAQQIRYPHKTWVLDDGDRGEMRAAAEAAGIGYISRGEGWDGYARHAKAGNLNNALMVLQGEFLLILDADQIPAPQILDRTLGYFTDEQVALVQTPQFFQNVTPADPLGSQAPLFYGPIQQGKDGWNAAFFCGSNALLRREALMQLGVIGYVEDVERTVQEGLRRADSALARAGKRADPDGSLEPALAAVRAAAASARAAVSAGEPLSDATYRFQRQVDSASRRVVDADMALIYQDLAAIADVSPDINSGNSLAQIDEDALHRLAQRDWTPLAAVESVRDVLQALDVDRAEEAQAIMPMATISVTEDMATAMRLHSLGWRSVYHHETMARGLAPEDLGTMLKQRLRWAQGTLQVLLRENPLTQHGLTWGQRFMYLSTMWTYLSGFAAVIYLVAPVLFLCFGVHPLKTYGPSFLMFFLPYFVANQLLFLVIARGVKTWRGQQYSLALFPLWIRAVVTAVGNVYFGRSLQFVVTPKTQSVRTPQWRFVKPQLITIVVLIIAFLVGIARQLLGYATNPWDTAVNLIWVCYDLAVLSVIIQAALFKGSHPSEQGERPAWIPAVAPHRTMRTEEEKAT